ncbi:MAG: hypothetical protein J0G30_05985 [Actinomycetales bacterium]|nr:hypothetical protein [Actinomycetales bacterium]
MPDTPSSPRRRRRIDARLVIGLVLVLASVAGVVALVAAVDRRVPVFAAAHAIAPGERLDEGALVLRQVALDGAGGLYLTPGAGLDDAVALAPIREGELVALSAVGAAGELDAASVVLALASPLSASVEPGDRVDIWIATPAESGITAADAGPPAPPAVLVADAVVVRVVADDGLVGSKERLGVEVLVPRDRVARVVQALADGSSLAAVPAGAPGANEGVEGAEDAEGEGGESADIDATGEESSTPAPSGPPAP